MAFNKYQVIKGAVSYELANFAFNYFLLQVLHGETPKNDNNSMRALLKDENLTEEQFDSLDDSTVIEGVKKFPVRIKCALLSWSALNDILNKY